MSNVCFSRSKNTQFVLNKQGYLSIKTKKGDFRRVLATNHPFYRGICLAKSQSGIKSRANRWYTYK